MLFMGTYRGSDLHRNLNLPMTIIEIRLCGKGWECFEASGVEPVFWVSTTQSAMHRAAPAFVPVRFGFS